MGWPSLLDYVKRSEEVSESIKSPGRIKMSLVGRTDM